MKHNINRAEERLYSLLTNKQQQLLTPWLEGLSDAVCVDVCNALAYYELGLDDEGEDMAAHLPSTPMGRLLFSALTGEVYSYMPPLYHASCTIAPTKNNSQDWRIK